jgi:hypothetical protein
MTIAKFDKVNLNILRADINAALAAVAEKHGIKIGAGSARYLDTTATFKLECVANGAGTGDDTVSARIDKFAEAFKRHAPMLFNDLTMEATYRIGSDNYKIVGYNSRAREYPLLLKNISSGKVYKFAEDRVREAKVVG